MKGQDPCLIHQQRQSLIQLEEQQTYGTLLEVQVGP